MFSVQRVGNAGSCKTNLGKGFARRAISSQSKPSQWELAGRMSEAVARYESRIANRAGLDLDKLAPVDAELHRAFATGVKPIRSQRKIYAWLTILR